MTVGIRLVPGVAKPTTRLGWDTRRSVDLFAALGDPQTLDFAKRHKAIVDRFGRFPHRNAVLGRTSTAEELEFLQRPDSSF